MATTHQKVSLRGTAEILVLGAALGLVVWMLTSDVVIGVIAGGGLAAVMRALARSWVGRGGSHLSRT